jgi:prepilin-type N-terminal cleavage/methylation domain-containing protein/prepilin-type processing-associated H-X9-DG protein
MQRKMRKQSKQGFTLVELLVVIGIIALLVSVLLPALGRAQRAARTTACLSNLRQIGMAFNMYINEYKGYIVFPAQDDVNYSPKTVYWHQRLSAILNKKDVRGNSNDVSQIQQVLRGCPEWNFIDNTGDGKPDSDKTGYGMSRRLRSPESRTRYHFPVDGNGAFNGPQGSDATPTPPDVYLPPPWRITQIKKPSSRILFGDSRNTWLDPSKADYTVSPINPGWDLTVGIMVATSGDVGRHSAYRWVQATDPKYKQMRANYSFVDGHCETLDPITAERNINDPH